MRKQLQARVGFVERLVAFWSNHFAVSVAKSNELRVAAGPFEREAIRPNMLGKFSALLRAAESHPAMILYLDNQNSIGPDAAPGKFAGRGLNENLAREILELHTLGVGSGYTQADVTELARVLTGWSVAGPDSEAGAAGRVSVQAQLARAGPAQASRQDLRRSRRRAGTRGAGRSRTPSGDGAPHRDEARAPLRGRRSAGRSRRRARAQVHDSDGDLAVVASTLVSDDRAWSAKPTKIRTPLEFVIGAARATAFSRSDAGSLSSKRSTCSACRFGSRRSERLLRHERRLGLG